MILNDTQITKLCVLERTKLVTPSNPNQLTVGPSGVQASTLLHYDTTPREVELSAEEIAAFVPMIEPFCPDLIRFEEDRRIISRGTTSYGYDVSLSDKEVKLFTNINSTEIDPKRLDERCLVDAQVREDVDGAKYVVLPPNSYLLGHTVEYFRMPRDLVAVCLGKCLAGDTRITDQRTGAILRMDECIEPMSVAALTVDTGKIGLYRTEGLINNGSLPMMRLETTSGHRQTATGTHPFRVWGGWKPLSELKVGDRIAVARTEAFVGTGKMPLHEARLLGYMTADGQCYAPGGSPTFTKNEEHVVELFKKDAEAMGFVCSENQKGVIRLVNKIGRGGIVEENRAAAWLDSHRMKVKSAQKHVPLAIQCAEREVVKEYLSALFTCDGSVQLRGPVKDIAIIEYYTISTELAEQLRIMLRRMGLFFMHRRQKKIFDGKAYDLHVLRITSPDEIRKFDERVGMIPGSRKDQVLKQWCARGIVSNKSNFDTLPPEAWVDLDRIMDRLGRSYLSIGVRPNRNQSVPLKPFLSFAHEVRDQELLALVNSDLIWDTVASIETASAETAYDFTVPGPHNFIAGGIVVHNSTYARAGVLVNVTPIEPGFEGNVVIEVGNSTGLPVRIYLNEGISQFLFLQGDPCEVSYADRGGKYQGQTGVTLPRV